MPAERGPLPHERTTPSEVRASDDSYLRHSHPRCEPRAACLTAALSVSFLDCHVVRCGPGVCAAVASTKGPARGSTGRRPLSMAAEWSKGERHYLHNADVDRALELLEQGKHAFGMAKRRHRGKPPADCSTDDEPTTLLQASRARTGMHLRKSSAEGG